MNKPSIYGAWISKKGDFIPVIKEECHAEIAYEILHAKKPTRKYSIYKIMMRLGYVRIVFVSGGHIAEYSKFGGTSKQRDWIRLAEKVDVWQ